MMELLAHLLGLYVGIAAVAIGFAIMAAGKAGAERGSRLFFVRPLAWAVERTRLALIAVLVTTWTLLVRFLLRPLAQELTFWLRWLGGRPSR